MRFDFSEQNNKSRGRAGVWNKKRIIRATIFVGIGLLIGFWLNKKYKNSPPPKVEVAAQADTAPKQVSEQVKLPSQISKDNS